MAPLYNTLFFLDLFCSTNGYSFCFYYIMRLKNYSVKKRSIEPIILFILFFINPIKKGCLEDFYQMTQRFLNKEAMICEGDSYNVRACERFH